MSKRVSARWVIISLAAIAGGALLVRGPGPRADAAPTIDQINELVANQDWEQAIASASALLEEDPANPGGRFALALATHSSGDHQGAVPLHRSAAEDPRYRSVALYNLSCALALSGDADASLDALREARRAGYGWLHEAGREELDSEIDLIRTDPRFVEPRPIEFVPFEDGAGTSCTYALHLPDDFDPEKPLPVLIALGPGPESEGTARWGLRSLWGEAAIMRGWAVVATSRPAVGWRSHEGVALMGELMNHVATEVEVEGGKFHLAGCSNGGASAWVIALALPSRVHSLTAVPGNPPRAGGVKLDGLKNVPVSMHVGADDGPWLRVNQRVKADLEVLGYSVELHVYEDVGHVIGPIQGGVLMDELTERHEAIMSERDKR